MVKYPKSMLLERVVFIQDGIKYIYWKKIKKYSYINVSYINVEGTPLYTKTMIERQ